MSALVLFHSGTIRFPRFAARHRRGCRGADQWLPAPRSRQRSPSIPGGTRGCSARWRGAAGGQGPMGRGMATGLAERCSLTSQGNSCCSSPHRRCLRPPLPAALGCLRRGKSPILGQPRAALGPLCSSREHYWGPDPTAAPEPAPGAALSPGPSLRRVLGGSWGPIPAPRGGAVRRHRPAAGCSQLGVRGRTRSPWCGASLWVPGMGGSDRRPLLTHCTALPGGLGDAPALCGAASRICIKRNSDY